MENDGWWWDGDLKPTDYAFNRLTRLQVYSDENHWKKIIEDYEAGTD